MNPGTLIAMVLATLVGLLGLYAASHAVDAGIYLFGLVIFAFSIVFDLWMIKLHFDAAEQH
jgi:Zn-dependent membrane protease YugP